MAADARLSSVRMLFHRRAQHWVPLVRGAFYRPPYPGQKPRLFYIAASRQRPTVSLRDNSHPAAAYPVGSLVHLLLTYRYNKAKWLMETGECMPP